MKEDSVEDKTIGRLVADGLRTQLRAQDSGCPDAEVLGAYSERRLVSSERVACEAHLATCMRCQGQVAELVRLSEADEPLPVQVGQVPAFAPAPARAPRVWSFRLAWAAPVLLALVVAGLWYTGEFRQALRQPQEATLKPPEPAQLPSAAEAEALRVAAAPAAKREPLKAREKESAEAVSPLPPVVSEAAEAERKVAGVGGAPAEAPPGPSGAITTPGERARLAAAASPGGRYIEMGAESRRDQLADRAMARGLPAGAAPEAEGLATEKKEVLALGKARALPGVKVLGSAPMFTPSWRVGRRGLIQRLDPSGTWVSVTSGVIADLFDITFAGPSVGWAVGQEGTVLRTTDNGVTWSRIPTPATEDLVRVSATSDLTATAMSRTGRILTTKDGGKTWKVSQ